MNSSSAAIFVLLVCGASWASLNRHTRPYSFAIWVLAFVGSAYFSPALFTSWAGIPCRKLISPLLQVAMFGMGATLTISDFSRVLKMPRGIGVGMVLQFTVMPVSGWLLATVSHLPPEIAAGVVLIGACPGGVASNVITYLAKGNVALSVTMTACSTLLSPIMTPLAMSLLAGRLVNVPFAAMMTQIIWIVFLPIAIGLLVNTMLQKLRWDPMAMEKALSVIAMVAICVICAIIMADANESLASVGPMLVLVVALHNSIGYLLGYWGARAAGLVEADCRTVAIEVGMQNGGLGASLAMSVLKSPQIALPSAVFAPWMSATGSILAAWWRKRPVVGEAGPEPSGPG